MLAPRSVAAGLLALLVVGLVSVPTGAAEWGTLKGRFVYDGKAPVPKKLTLTKDTEYCMQHHPVDETLVVGPDGGLANAVVSIRIKRGTKLEVHPDYASSANEKVVVDNKFCRFEPHVAMMRTSQTLVLKNSDTVAHNTKADFFTNESFNLMIPAQNIQELNLSQAERIPGKIGCNIHPWMNGYLIVREDPYAAISGSDGAFEIKNIPAGEHEFAFWHETAGNLRDLAVKGGKTSRRGRVKLTIPAGGVLDLGDIKVSPTLFSGK